MNRQPDHEPDGAEFGPAAGSDAAPPRDDAVVKADIRRLYAYHIVSAVALSFMVSELYTTTLFLRLELSKSQIGLIVGLAMWLPSLINLLTAAAIQKRGLNQLVAAVFPIIRLFLACLFLVLPIFTRDAMLLTVGFAVIYILFMIFPFVSNNCMAALIRSHVPEQTLGHHSAVMMWLWDFPLRIVLIFCGWYLDRHSSGGDAELFRAMWVLLLITGLFQIPGCVLILRLSKRKDMLAAGLRVRTTLREGLFELLQPFAGRRAASIAFAIFAANIALAMLGSFFFIFMREVHHWPLMKYTIVSAVLSAAGAILSGMWGRLADRMGGKNVFFIAQLGTAASLLVVALDLPMNLWVLVALAWGGGLGVFGSGLMVGQRYLLLTAGPPEKSNLYIAALTFVIGCSFLVGSATGGWLLDVCTVRFAPDGKGDLHYRVFWGITAVVFIIAALCARVADEGKRRFSAGEMIIEIYQEVRGLFNKWR